MQTVGITLFHITVTMAVLFVLSLLMGKRKIGEFNQFDFIVTITMGIVAGFGIVYPHMDLATVVISMILIGLIQYLVRILTIKIRKNCKLQSKNMCEPVVLIENGKIIKAGLTKAQLSLETVFGLMREKGIFDINEVELAILESHGKLSVLKKAEYRPLTAMQINLAVPPNKILTPVIIEGKLQFKNLEYLGFSVKQVKKMQNQYKDSLENILVAFMDQNHRVYIINKDVQETGVFHY